MIYWVSTVLLSTILFVSALSYMLHQGSIDGVRELGFPHYFRIQLSVMKLTAAIILITPFFPPVVKEWAYIGAALFFITAIVAHFAHGDPWFLNAINGLFLIVLFTSRHYQTT